MSAPSVRPTAVSPAALPLPRLLRAVSPGRDGREALVSIAEAAAVALEAAGRLGLARTPEVGADDPWSEAGRKVMRFHLARMLAHVPGTLEGEDPDDVHAMRVASRRVRAGWRVFGDGFDRPVARRQVGQLRVLGSELGMVRDLDVQ